MNPFLTERLQPFGTTIFAEMSALAVATGAINLGQGFPDTDGPDAVKQAAIDAIRAGHNQYPPGIGIPELRRAIRAHQQRFYGLDYDADGGDPRHRGRHRGDRGGAARALRAGRRGGHFRAVLRLLRGVHRDGGSDRAGSLPCALPTMPSTPTSCAPPSRRVPS